MPFFDPEGSLRKAGVSEAAIKRMSEFTSSQTGFHSANPRFWEKAMRECVMGGVESTSRGFNYLPDWFQGMYWVVREGDDAWAASKVDNSFGTILALIGLGIVLFSLGMVLFASTNQPEQSTSKKKLFIIERTEGFVKRYSQSCCLFGLAYELEAAFRYTAQEGHILTSQKGHMPNAAEGELQMRLISQILQGISLILFGAALGSRTLAGREIWLTNRDSNSVMWVLQLLPVVFLSLLFLFGQDITSILYFSSALGIRSAISRVFPHARMLFLGSTLSVLGHVFVGVVSLAYHYHCFSPCPWGCPLRPGFNQNACKYLAVGVGEIIGCVAINGLLDEAKQRGDNLEKQEAKQQKGKQTDRNSARSSTSASEFDRETDFFLPKKRSRGSNGRNASRGSRK